MSKAQRFAELHAGGKPFILANAWDAASARIFEKAGFSAIGTTSAGIAASRGYRDGQKIPLNEMLDNVKQVLSAVSLPVSVDIEAGFGETEEEVVGTIAQLVALGVVGINLEDGTGDPLFPLYSIDQQVKKIAAIRREFPTLWIYTRIDAFYLGLPDKEKALGDTIERARAYLDAGANSIFVVVDDRELIAKLTKEISAPINVLASAKLPSMQELQELGVARVSLGSGPMRAALGLLEEIAQELLVKGTYEQLTRRAVSFSALQELFIC